MIARSEHSILVTEESSRKGEAQKKRDADSCQDQD
jgi:hypothetical protein